MDSLTIGLDDPAAFWRSVVESAGLGVWSYSRATGERRLSPKCQQIHNFHPSEAIPKTDDAWLAMVHPDDVAMYSRNLAMIRGGEVEDVVFEYREKGRDGQWRWILCHSHAFQKDEAGRAMRFIGVDTDVTSMKATEQARALNEKQLEIAVAMAGLGIWNLNFSTGAVTWDSRLREIYGVPKADGPIPDDTWESRLHPDDRYRVLWATKEAIKTRQDYSLDYKIVRSDGEVRHIRSKGSFVVNGFSQPTMLGVDWDVTDDLMQAFRLEQLHRIASDRLEELVQAQKELERMSQHDQLTGLPNRRSLQHHLDRLQSSELSVSGVAFIMLDIDEFKTANDTHGHAFGDRLLQAVAGALESEISPHGFLARTGGDEFLAILDNVANADFPMAVAASAIVKAQQVSGAMGHAITLSVGIDTGCVRSKSIEEFFSSADRALYRAKRLGGATVIVA
ncbi:MAG: hypothetical protein CFE33_20780 [Pseudorhodobacter sp. PARRP1]|nr:MAG: hypothetical protein CFE33_20780 [Pseudorhodobacter sp. PARRP1]